MKRIALLFIAVFIHRLLAAQQFVLFTETFENPTNQFVFDSAGPSLNTGSNKWIINNVYNGQGINPDTPPEDSVVLGTIFNAPHSKYLHITDSSSGPFTANWNPDSVSDRFVVMSDGLCTLGVTDIYLTFFWTCEGNAAAYGQLYYSADNGPWIATGQPQYYNQRLWKYETVTDPVFANRNNLKFGFRWLNGSAGNRNVAFGVDDIIVAGNFITSNPLQVTVLDSSVCQGNNILFKLNINPALCDGNYEVQMSNATGSFQNPYNLGALSLASSDTSGVYATLNTINTLVGNCFRLRVQRTSPLPVIFSDTSACFSITTCGPSIYNLTAPVLADVDTACAGSAVDIFFNSSGSFLTGNSYIAELSDSSGSFVNAVALGTYSSNSAFAGFPAGDIQGIIPPGVAPGCGYYIRVRATAPATTSSLIGPYCIKRCDVLTNSYTDIHLCIGSTSAPLCDSLSVGAHTWDNSMVYYNCNFWKVEVRNIINFQLVDLSFRAFQGTNSGTFNFCSPSTADSLPFAPGTYYMRIVSTCTNKPYDQNGTIIRLTIGAPLGEPPQLSFTPSNDSVFCRTELVKINVSPYSSASSYLWYSSLINNGNAVQVSYNPLTLQLTNGVATGRYPFYVQEENNGCVGPLSAPLSLYIIDKPSGLITGPAVVCAGDTISLATTFFKETYYSWTAPAEVTLTEASNNITRLVFDTTGIFSVSNSAVNKCGANTGNFTVTVKTPDYNVLIKPDTTICNGDTIDLAAQLPFTNSLFTSVDTGSSKRKGGMFNLIAHSDVYIDSFALRFQYNNGVSNIASTEIFMKQGTFRGFEQSLSAWPNHVGYFNYHLNPSLQWTTISQAINWHIAAGDSSAFYVAMSVGDPHFELLARTNNTLPTVYKSDGLVDFIGGTGNDSLFGASYTGQMLNVRIYYHSKGGYRYVWSTGDTTQTIPVAPVVNTAYGVSVTNLGICPVTDTAQVRVVNCQVGVNNMASDGQLVTIWPNPTNGKVVIEGLESAESIIIYNLSGENVIKRLNFDKIVDLSDLPDGYYMISIKKGANRFNQKIILLK